MMGQDAALAGGRGTHFPSLRAAPGPRPEALGPPARSSLMAWPAAWAMAESAARQPFRRRDGAPKGAVHRQRCANEDSGCARRRVVSLRLEGGREDRPVPGLDKE